MTARHRARLFSAASVVGFAAAAALGDPQSNAARAQDFSAEATRVLPWTGGDRLWLDVAADTEYVRGPDAKVSITGPKWLVDHIAVDGGHIRYDAEMWREPKPNRDEWRHHPVHILVTTPSLASAGMNGSGRLDLGSLSQNHLEVTLSGSGLVKANGAVRRLNVRLFGSGGFQAPDLKADLIEAQDAGSGWLDISGSSHRLQLSVNGSGRAELGGLKVGDANVVLSGSGSASLSPKTSAVLTLVGTGNVRLLSEPVRLKVNRSGSARVFHPNEN